MTHIDTTSRFAIDPLAAAAMPTGELRRHFHIADLFQPGRINLTYTHYDRMIVGGAMPSAGALELSAIKPTGTKNFLDRRELIAVNIGGAGTVQVGGTAFELAARDMIYVGMGTESVRFSSKDASAPAKFYLLSAPAHQTHPTNVSRFPMPSASISVARKRLTNARFSSSFMGTA
jgi:4-deoxy-L-threo-5-hexosulose-uronate ketol-isomerase